MPTLVKGEKGEAGMGTEGNRRPACGTVSTATYNVRDGRGEGEDRQLFLGLCSTARAMEMTRVGVVFLQEMKIVDPTFANRSFKEYSILAAAADSERRGRGDPFGKEAG